MLVARIAGVGLFLMMFFLGGCAGGGATIEKGNLGAPAGTGFQVKTLHNEGRSRNYSVFVPHGYDKAKKYPAIVFLHGVGEAGSNGTSMLGVGIAPAIAERASTFPFIVIFPQSDSGYWNPDSKPAADALAALEEVKRTYSVDPDRVILTGLSTGGYGTWAIGARHREKFAALVPMCAFTSMEDVPALLNIPIWAFHNSGDMFVLAGGTGSMVNAINKAGGNARFTEYGALGHNCWDRAYNGSGDGGDTLFAWMLTQRRMSTFKTAATVEKAGNTSSVKTLMAPPAPPSSRSSSSSSAIVPELPEPSASAITPMEAGEPSKTEAAHSNGAGSTKNQWPVW